MKSMREINLDTYSLSLLTAKEDILNPRSSTNWALFAYDGIMNRLKLVDSGVGGLEELMTKLHPRRPLYGMCRVGKNQSHIVMILWMGKELDEYRSAECASHLPAIRAFFREVQIFLPAHTLDEITEDRICSLARKAAMVTQGPRQRAAPRRDHRPEVVGTNYKRTIAAAEIQRIQRDSFWAQAEREEDERKKEEQRRAAEDRRRRETERLHQERREAAERERKMMEREQKIKEQRRIQAQMEKETRRQHRMKWEQQEREREEDEKQARYSHSESEDKAAEAAALVAQRTVNPREFFRQLSSSSIRSDSQPSSPHPVQSPYRRLQRSQTENIFVFNEFPSFTPSSPYRSPYRSAVASPYLPSTPTSKSPTLMTSYLHSPTMVSSRSPSSPQPPSILQIQTQPSTPPNMAEPEIKTPISAILDSLVFYPPPPTSPELQLANQGSDEAQTSAELPSPQSGVEHSPKGSEDLPEVSMQTQPDISLSSLSSNVCTSEAPVSSVPHSSPVSPDPSCLQVPQPPSRPLPDLPVAPQILKDLETETDFTARASIMSTVEEEELEEETEGQGVEKVEMERIHEEQTSKIRNEENEVSEKKYGVRSCEEEEKKGLEEKVEITEKREEINSGQEEPDGMIMEKHTNERENDGTIVEHEKHIEESETDKIKPEENMNECEKEQDKNIMEESEREKCQDEKTMEETNSENYEDEKIVEVSESEKDQNENNVEECKSEDHNKHISGEYENKKHQDGKIEELEIEKDQRKKLLEVLVCEKDQNEKHMKESEKHMEESEREKHQNGEIMEKSEKDKDEKIMDESECDRDLDEKTIKKIEIEKHNEKTAEIPDSKTDQDENIVEESESENDQYERIIDESKSEKDEYEKFMEKSGCGEEQDKKIIKEFKKDQDEKFMEESESLNDQDKSIVEASESENDKDEKMMEESENKSHTDKSTEKSTETSECGKDENEKIMKESEHENNYEEIMKQSESEKDQDERILEISESEEDENEKIMKESDENDQDENENHHDVKMTENCNSAEEREDKDYQEKHEQSLMNLESEEKSMMDFVSLTVLQGEPENEMEGFNATDTEGVKIEERNTPFIKTDESVEAIIMEENVEKHNIPESCVETLFSQHAPLYPESCATTAAQEIHRSSPESINNCTENESQIHSDITATQNTSDLSRLDLQKDHQLLTNDSLSVMLCSDEDLETLKDSSGSEQQDASLSQPASEQSSDTEPVLCTNQETPAISSQASIGPSEEEELSSNFSKCQDVAVDSDLIAPVSHQSQQNSTNQSSDADVGKEATLADGTPPEVRPDRKEFSPNCKTSTETANDSRNENKTSLGSGRENERQIIGGIPALLPGNTDGAMETDHHS